MTNPSSKPTPRPASPEYFKLAHPLFFIMAVPAKELFNVFTDVRGMVTFYLFILEESIQTAMMGAYMARKDGMISQSQIIALELKQGLIADAKAFNTLVGPVAYPMNDAFAAFFQASEDMCTFYIQSTPPEE